MTGNGVPDSYSVKARSPRPAARNKVPVHIHAMAGTLLEMVLVACQSTLAEGELLGFITATVSNPVASTLSSLQGEDFDRRFRQGRTLAAGKRSGERNGLLRVSGRSISKSASLDTVRGSRTGLRQTPSHNGHGKWIRRSPTSQECRLARDSQAREAPNRSLRWVWPPAYRPLLASSRDAAPRKCELRSTPSESATALPSRLSPSCVPA